MLAVGSAHACRISTGIQPRSAISGQHPPVTCPLISIRASVVQTDALQDPKDPKSALGLNSGPPRQSNLRNASAHRRYIFHYSRGYMSAATERYRRARPPTSTSFSQEPVCLKQALRALLDQLDPVHRAAYRHFKTDCCVHFEQHGLLWSLSLDLDSHEKELILLRRHANPSLRELSRSAARQESVYGPGRDRFRQSEHGAAVRTVYVRPIDLASVHTVWRHRTPLKIRFTAQFYRSLVDALAKQRCKPDASRMGAAKSQSHDLCEQRRLLRVQA